MLQRLATILLPSVFLSAALVVSSQGADIKLEFRPLPPDSDAGNTLIWYKTSNKTSFTYFQEKLNKFLKRYYDQDDGSADNENLQDCDNMNKPDAGKVCKFKLFPYYAPCLKKYGYNYDSENEGPCIFLKLNQVYGWKPDCYNSSDANKTNMPTQLKERILTYEIHARRDSQRTSGIVWVDCVGENPADVENIGPISYYPFRGFSEKYFPFTNVKGYLSPLVAVHFEKPKRGVIINIECRVWARNIVYDRDNQKGLVHFELLIDY